MGSDKRFYARRGGFQYGPAFPDDVVETDQVFNFGHGINDERMLRLGQVAEVPKGTSLFRCRICSRDFISDRSRDIHGRRRHEERDRGPQIREDVKGLTATEIQNELTGIGMVPEKTLDEVKMESEERKLNNERPIFFEKSEASLKAGEGIPEVSTAPVSTGPESSEPESAVDEPATVEQESPAEEPTPRRRR